MIRSLVSGVGREKTGICRGERPKSAMGQADGLGRRLAYPEAPDMGSRPSGPAAALPCHQVSYQRSAFSHQLIERIQKVMIEDKVDHFASDEPNFLFWLKADC